MSEFAEQACCPQNRCTVSPSLQILWTKRLASPATEYITKEVPCFISLLYSLCDFFLFFFFFCPDCQEKHTCAPGRGSSVSDFRHNGPLKHTDLNGAPRSSKRASNTQHVTVLVGPQRPRDHGRVRVPHFHAHGPDEHANQTKRLLFLWTCAAAASPCY